MTESSAGEPVLPATIGSTDAVGHEPPGDRWAFALVSHVDTCCIGVNMDTAAVRDPDRLVSYLRESFDELLALAPAAPETSVAVA